MRDVLGGSRAAGTRQQRKDLKTIARALRPGGVILMQDIRASSHVRKNIDPPLGTLI